MSFGGDENVIDSFQGRLIRQVRDVLGRQCATSTGLAFGIDNIWLENCGNRVLCCSGCNGFKNRFSLPIESMVPAEVTRFVELRDAIFAIRKDLILLAFATEREI
jgi:hypothetical protein